MCDLESRRDMAGEPRVKWMGRVKKIDAPTLAKRSFPSKEMGKVGTTRKEMVKGKPLKIQLSSEI